MIGFNFERWTALDGQKITFTTHDVREADEIFSKLKHGKPIEVIIRHKRKKRSQDANSYAWVLMDKIAKVINSTKEEVYKDEIHKVGVFDYVCIPTKALPQFIRNWNARGTGWLTEVWHDCKIPDCTKVCCYYGSSVYDTEQMARLIDEIVSDAKELGIETMTNKELAEIKREWGE